MKHKELKAITAKGLVELAKDIKLKGYSSLKSDELRKKLDKEDLSEVDFSKYPVYAPKDEKSKGKKATNVPSSRRRSIRMSKFGRR